MQITTGSAPNADQVWDWHANINAGEKIFQSKLGTVGKYQNKLQDFVNKTFLAQINQQLVQQNQQPLDSIVLAPFSADMIMQDAVRGYNGWNGSDPISPTQFLHEFALETAVQGMLSAADLTITTVTVGSKTVRQGTVHWTRVLAASRPSPDKNYVVHVLGAVALSIPLT